MNEQNKYLTFFNIIIKHEIKMKILKLNYFIAESDKFS
jgi:hypothetical protein